MTRTVIPMIVLLFLCGCRAERENAGPTETGKTLKIEQVDLDEDGETEVLIENEYLKLVALLPQTKREEKYATRFVWGGWITDVIFKPTKLSHMVGEYFRHGDIDWDHRHYLGLPDQFEKTIPLEETDTVRKELLIGVGVLSRKKSPQGKWSKRRLEQTAPWEFGVAERNGTRAIQFQQRLATTYGHAYQLVRSIHVAPGRSTFRMETTLRNTGTKPIDTDWYLHPFFAFGGYEGECWQEIPLRLGEGKPTRAQSFAMPIMKGTGTVWGWLTPPELGGKSWFATGNRGKGMFFGAAWGFPLLRVRNWLRGHTYAIEPFTKIDLAPGKEATWSMDIVLGSGMWRAVDVNRHGALDIRMTKDGACEVVFMPTQRRSGAVVHAQAEGRKGLFQFNKKAVLPVCTPDEPGRVVLDIPPNKNESLRVSAAIVDGNETLLEGCRALGRDEGDPLEPRKRLCGKKGLLVVDPKDRGRRNVPPYLSAALGREGMALDQVSPAELPADLKPYDVVLLLGVTGVPADRIEAYLKSGGSLFATPPFDEKLLPLLPVEGKPELVERCEWPTMPRQSGDAKAENIPALRVHLEPVGDRPITAGLPFYPATFQSIARLYRTKEKPGSRVVIRYSTDRLPALILSPKNRTAVFMSPLTWGQPAHWILWGTFSEHHRELVTRIVAWCCRR